MNSQLILVLALFAAVAVARPQQSVEKSLNQIGEAVKIATQETAQSAASVAANTALRAVAAGQSVEQAVRQETSGKRDELVLTTILPLPKQRQKRQNLLRVETTTPHSLILSSSLQPVGSAAHMAQSEVGRSALDAGIAAGNAAIDTANAGEIAAEKVANIAEKAAIAATRS